VSQRYRRAIIRLFPPPEPPGSSSRGGAGNSVKHVRGELCLHLGRGWSATGVASAHRVTTTGGDNSDAEAASRHHVCDGGKDAARERANRGDGRAALTPR
jgi:hypothetical protein